MNWISIVLMLVAVSCFSDSTRNDNIKKFNAAQICFKDASLHGTKRITCAQDSLDAGLLIFDDSSKNIILLTHSLAMAYPKLSTKRYDLLKHALKLFEKLHGNESIELIDLLMDLANEEHGNRYINKRYTRASGIFSSEVGKQSLDYAFFCLQISEEAVRYLNTKGRLRTSSKYAQLASEIFMEQSGRSSDGYGKANLRLAKNQMAIKKYRKAIPYLKNALDNPTVSKFARGFLVTVYEQLNESVLAASYRIPVDLAPSENKNTLYQAIFQNWPGSIGGTGWAKVEYTITKLGVTADLKVIDGSHRSAKRSLLNVVSEWRFIPAYVEGKAVDTTGVVAKYRWKVHKR